MLLYISMFGLIHKYYVLQFVTVDPKQIYKNTRNKTVVVLHSINKIDKLAKKKFNWKE